MPQEDITQTTPSMVTPVKDSCRRSSRSRRDEPCSPLRQRPYVGRSAEADARWIIQREDDPEEESPQPNDETAQSNDETAEKGSAVMAELKTLTDKCSAEDDWRCRRRGSVDPGSLDEGHIHRDSSTSFCRG